ncbi:hypothetical protein CVIRNUC_010433 [Coccomyxa viridis]|uniref:Uncharacterized protein n=1 Tax=Coccomyxa viridis TaxID=1274662 RepID=A0AAV1IJ05_9CHLO|nr:hypothetical protein CVIRNUC_010433 [Coccomyxa viridis]
MSSKAFGSAAASVSGSAPRPQQEPSHIGQASNSPLWTFTPFSRSRFAMSYPSHDVNPANAGWTYQGGNAQSRVEYWAKDGCKMDYYPTTGTVKTSMDHPSQGKTQMFRRGLDDAGFQQVLENPRYHTGQGYQTKASKYYNGK